ncbi:MAG TPA: SMP-30/gluconolactonase/LRE family protein, partial [Polyangiaceae bacterium]|nr:SMP-30/gluconolactonase/LRE family protein [Polyangiaceae bacterium]
MCLSLAACGDSGTTSTSTSGSGGATGSGGGTTSTGAAGGGGSGGGTTAVDPLEGIGQVELIQGGFDFVEGPVWLATPGVLRFSDIPQNVVLELDPSTGDISKWRSDSAGTNGNALAPNGDLVMCEQGGRRVARSVADVATPVLVAGDYMGTKLNSPNDAIVRSDGTIFFTDPTYGLGGPSDIGFQGVYRVTLAGDVELVDDAHSQPNGIALSPDESKLYVSDSDLGGLFVYEVATDGTTGPATELVEAAPGDGMAIDDAGNIYLSTADGVTVYAPDGSLWGTIAVPEQPANCAFGGADRKTLYITARNGLYSVTMSVA